MHIVDAVLLWWERMSAPLPVILEQLNYVGFIGGLILIGAFYLSFFHRGDIDPTRMGHEERQVVLAEEIYELKALLIGILLSVFGLVWTSLAVLIILILYRIFKR